MNCLHLSVPVTSLRKGWDVHRLGLLSKKLGNSALVKPGDYWMDPGGVKLMNAAYGIDCYRQEK